MGLELVSLFSIGTIGVCHHYQIQNNYVLTCLLPFIGHERVDRDANNFPASNAKSALGLTSSPPYALMRCLYIGINLIIGNTRAS
jgi:hypothetical protein